MGLEKVKTHRVRPAISTTLKKGENESVNLFEVLEDRYAYEGFNKFFFFLFMFIILYQWLASSIYSIDMVGAANFLKIYYSINKFERADFNAWALKKVKVINDQNFLR